MKRLVLIDTHAVIHRAFHALPPLAAPDGTPTNAVYGFALLFLKMLSELKPDYVAAASDHPSPTFRHIAFERYKAERKRAPDELYRQIPLVHQLLGAFGVPVIEREGYEADDVIGTIVALVRKRHPAVEIVIVTGDLDALQLADAHTKVFTMRKGITDTALYDEAAVRERYGLAPRQLADFRGLRGDPSDNIPGVRGIGEKTASELLSAHGTVEDVYRALKRGALAARPSVLAALKDHEADALLSKSLAIIERNAPITFTLAAARFKKGDLARGRPFLERLGFASLVRRIEGASAGRTLSPADDHARNPATAAPNVKTAREFAEVPRGTSPPVVIADIERSLLGIAVDAHTAYTLPLAALRGPAARTWLSSGQTYLFDAKPLIRRGLAFDPKTMRDLALMWYLTDPGRRAYTADALAGRGPDHAPDSPAETALGMFAEAPRLEALLKSEGLSEVYDALDAPLIPILASMEERGIGFDSRPLVALSRSMARELARLQANIHKAAGVKFNINSPRQLAEVLFERLKLSPSGIRKTEKSGTLSTDERELAKLKTAHPIVAGILAWRETAKLKSTYVDVLPTLVGPDGRIHTTWNQMATATGRLSSTSPNLQNIPIRSRHGKTIRRCFVAAKGFELVAFDYSQLELRIAAALAHDEKMLAAFRSGQDIHRLTASEIANIPPDRVTPELRYRAKTLNFGVLYGMGARAFAESAGVSRDEAEHFIEEYFRDFSGIARFIAEIKTQAREQGFTRTAFGRKRSYPEFGGTGFRREREAERMAVNHPIQGTEADIMRKAMIEIERAMRARGLTDDVRLLLQVHDELVFEIRARRVGQAAREISQIMQDTWQSAVPLVVAVKRGRTWGDLE